MLGLCCTPHSQSSIYSPCWGLHAGNELPFNAIDRSAAAKESDPSLLRYSFMLRATPRPDPLKLQLVILARCEVQNRATWRGLRATTAVVKRERVVVGWQYQKDRSRECPARISPLGLLRMSKRDGCIFRRVWQMEEVCAMDVDGRPALPRDC